jgi:hypothetical protein
MKAGNAATKRLLEAINASGFAYMVSSIFGDKLIIRIASGGNNTQLSHLTETWEKIQSLVSVVLGTN